MAIRDVQEYGEIPLEPGELMRDGTTRIRADVVQKKYVEWRSDVSGAAKGSRSEVAVTRRLFAQGVVGLVPLSGDLSVMVTPRYPASLNHMVTFCDWPTVALDVLRYYREDSEVAEDWMLDRIATDLLTSVRGLLSQGLIRSYESRTIATSSPKGRLDVRATVAREASRGVRYKAIVRYFERSETLPANQAMLAAVEWAHEWFDTRREATTGAARADMRGRRVEASKYLHALRFIEADRERRFLRDPMVRGRQEFPAARSEYRRAMQLSVALLERRSFSLDATGGDFALPTLLIETDLLFEEFVRRTLQQGLPDATVLDGNVLKPRRTLFEPATVPAGVPVATTLAIGSNSVAPDVLVERSGQTRVAIDVKYKRVASGHAERKDIEQVVTYGERLKCTEVLTVHPCESGQVPGLVLSGRVGRIRVWQYRMSLGDDIEQSAADMASAVDALSRVSDDV